MTPHPVEHLHLDTSTPENSLVEFRHLQAQLRALAEQLNPNGGEEERGLYHECIGAATEQPQFTGELTMRENKDLTMLVQRIEGFLAEREKPETIH